MILVLAQVALFAADHAEQNPFSVAAAIGAILTFVMQLAIMMNNNFREQRARRWALEDKEELARTTRHSIKNTDDHILTQSEMTRAMLEDIQSKAEDRLAKINQLHAEVVRRIEENTEVSKDAFKEANNVNEKLLGLGVQLVEKQPKPVVVVNSDPIPVKEIT